MMFKGTRLAAVLMAAVLALVLVACGESEAAVNEVVRTVEVEKPVTVEVERPANPSHRGHSIRIPGVEQ